MTPVVLGGGGLQGGIVHGATNATGLEIQSGQVTVPDLFATLIQALGIDPEHEYRTDFGAVAPITDHGQPIKEVRS